MFFNYRALAKFAPTVLTSFIVTWHDRFFPAPAQAPDQPAKIESPLGLAVRVTTVPAA